jgi:threonine dehydratase
VSTVLEITAGRVRDIAGTVAPHIRHTPLIPTPAGGFLKLESLQPTGSFKVRGFFAAALATDPVQLSRGILTVSAGNAALACAHVARELGVPCRVMMYETAPALKIGGVRALGAEAVLVARERIIEWIDRRGWEQDPEVFIHPFADLAVIHGHSSIVPEILEDFPEVDRVLVPVGGGGLISGIALGFAALKSEVRVVGVQSGGYPLWREAFAVQGPPSLTPDTIADGTSAPFNPLMFERLTRLVHEWITVPEAALRTAVFRIATDVKVVAEGAGSLAYAAMIGERSNTHTVGILSGGNIDASLLAELLAA